ncbi:hypothetical protein Q7P37_009640 [Cladosporium fusiforme]
MHAKVALLVAIGQIATAFEGPGQNEPRGPPANPTKPLATVTELENGHLPTCFTGHPTHPCPTYKARRDIQHDLNDLARKAPIKTMSWSSNHGAHSSPAEEPEVEARDAPLRVSDPEYIPEPNEWAIPQNFTFTDTISNRTHQSMTTSTSGHADLRTAIAQKADAMIASIMSDIHSPPAETSHPVAMPTAVAHEHNSTNSSSTPQWTATIGTLLNGAMFPGKMRPATTSSSSLETTSALPSIEAIPMSQSPNTTAADGTVQAFIHPINTESVAAAEATASSNSTSSSTATAHHRGKPTDAPSEDWDEARFDKALDDHLDSFDKEPSTAEKRDEPVSDDEIPEFRGSERENARESSSTRGSERENAREDAREDASSRGSAREDAREDARQVDEKKSNKEHKAARPEESSTTAETKPATLTTSTLSTSTSSSTSGWPRKVTTTGPQAVHWNVPTTTASAKSSSSTSAEVSKAANTTDSSSASATTTATSRNGRRFIS